MSVTVGRIIRFGCVAVMLGLASAVSAQGQDDRARVRQAQASDFQVISEKKANVMTTEECTGVMLLAVYVRPGSATQQRLDTIAKRIAKRYPITHDLSIVFMINRRAARLLSRFDGDDDEKIIPHVRGLYSRTKDGTIERLKFLPSGLTDDALPEIEASDDK